MAKLPPIPLGACWPGENPEPAHVEKPFPSPRDVKRFAGEGASEADLARGYLEPDIKGSPEYDANNYKDRFSEPMRTDADGNGFVIGDDDYRFRMKDRESRGFLTRPRIPTER